MDDGQTSPTSDSSPERAPLFDDSPMGSLYDYLTDHLTTTLAAAPLVDLTLYFELALI
jgi:hypothetical protein